MATVIGSLKRLWRGLFLQPSAYAEMRDDNNPFIEGIFLIAAVGMGVAIFGLVGTLLDWASSPGMAAIKDAVYGNLIQMPWYQILQEQAGQPFADQFRQQYEMGWRIFPVIFGAPDPGRAALGILLTPLGLILGWLAYGAVAHVIARLLGGEGTFSETLGVTALAVAPQLLNLALIFPGLTVGAVIGTWTLICRFTGLRIAHHNLTWPRVLAAAVLPGVILSLLASAVVAIGLVFAMPLLAATIAGGIR
jgi:hypothetical protein